MSEGISVLTHMLKIIGLITRLGQLDFAMDDKLSQNLILQSFSKFFSQFVINYYMNKLNTSLPELLNILKTNKNHFKSEKVPILLVDKISKKKTGHKGSNKKKKMNPKANISNKKVKSVSVKDTYFYYKKNGYWNRNCKHYLASLKQKEANIAKNLYKI